MSAQAPFGSPFGGGGYADDDLRSYDDDAVAEGHAAATHFSFESPATALEEFADTHPSLPLRECFEGISTEPPVRRRRANASSFSSSFEWTQEEEEKQRAAADW